MSWQYTDAVDEVAQGRGPNLLTGDYAAQNPGWTLASGVWSRAGGGSLHLHEGAPYAGPCGAPDTTHVLTATIFADVDAAVSWIVHLDTGAGPQDLAFESWADTIPGGAWVTVTCLYRTPPDSLAGSVTLTVDTPGAVQVKDVEASAYASQVVVTDVVGASFRTSDDLPGQVTFADDAVSGGPGIRIDPIDATGITTPPGVSPSMNGMVISGGVSTAGRTSFARFTPGDTLIRQASMDGTGPETWLRVEDGSLSMYTVPDATTPTANRSGVSVAGGVINIVSSPETGSVAAVNANPINSRLYYKSATGAEGIMATGLLGTYMEYTEPNGDSRRLNIDADGAWVEAIEGGVTKKFDLVGTTWTPLTLLNGWAPYAGGGGYYNGLRAQRTPLGIRLDGMVKGGAPGTVIAVLPDDMQDVAAKQFTGVVNGNATGYLGIHSSPAHGGKFVVSYLNGPAAPTFVSISVDASAL